MRGNRSELAPGRRSPQCHVNTRLDESTAEVRQTLLFWNDQNNALNASVKDSIAETFSCRMKRFSHCKTFSGRICAPIPLKDGLKKMFSIFLQVNLSRQE